MELEKNDYKKEHRKKMVAPIIIAVLFALYYIFIGVMFLWAPEIPVLVKVLMVAVPLALAGTIIYVLVERIKEIRSGEEDDLSKY